MSNTTLPVNPESEAPERPHAQRSASQLKYLVLCPGYKPEQKKRTHWVTQQGIRGHSAMESADHGDLQSNYESNLVQLCQDYEATLPPTQSVVKEFRVETILGRWGYLDTLRFRQTGDSRDSSEADLIDYKFVRKAEVEDAEVNLQGKDYVVGVFETFPQLDRVHVHFVMPRFGSVSTATFHRDQLPDLRLEVFSIINLAQKTDRKRAASRLFKPDFDVCRYCGRRATCQALFRLADKVAASYVGHPVPEVPANVHASQSRDPATLGALKALAAILEPWCQSVSHHTTDVALDEGIVPAGYVIDYLKGQRRISDPLALLRVGPRYGITVDDVLASSKVSIAQLEDVVMAKARRGEKAEKKAEFLDELRDANALNRSEDRPYLRKVSA